MLAPISLQTSSESSVAGLTSSKQCHQHITARAMGRLKPTLNSLNAHLKNVSTPLGTFPCSIMPIIDRKPIGGDNDDDHLSKLMHMQHRNGTNNDGLPVFASIPIGSTVVVQQEDSGPWTHRTIVGKGDHNHHDQSYILQITTTGRRITHDNISG